MRINKNKNYTTMSNVHLRDLNLSLKARGLLSTILSLPDNWNYSIGGLASICKENETCIKSGLKELKEAGYMVVEKLYSDESGTGKFKYVYNIFENPDDSEELREQVEKKKSERASRDANPPVEVPPVETMPLYKSTDKISTDIINTDFNKVFSGNEEKTINNNKVFSDGKIYHSPDIHYEYTKEEFKQFISQKVSYLLEDVAPEEDPNVKKPISDIITDFFWKYYESTGNRHPILTDVAYGAIILKLLNPIDVIWNSGYYLDVEAYQAMIEKFFSTNYGVRSGHSTDYRMPYFLQDTVLENLFYQAGLH